MLAFFHLTSGLFGDIVDPRQDANMKKFLLFLAVFICLVALFGLTFSCEKKAREGLTEEAAKTIDDLHVKGDKIVSIFTMWGTITGPIHNPLGDLPPTGKTFRLSGVAIDRIVNGKIAEEWLYFNVLDILQPIGFTLSPPQRPQPEVK